MFVFILIACSLFFFFFKQKTAYEMRISDWSSDVCSSDLAAVVNSFRANGGTQYEGPLQVAANWLREDVDPGDGMTERHEDSQNFIFLFSDGGEVYLPPASLVPELYDHGSGQPKHLALTPEAFSFCEPGAPTLSLPQLG